MSSIRFVCNWQVAPPLYTNGVIFSIPHRHKPIPEPPDYLGVFEIQKTRPFGRADGCVALFGSVPFFKIVVRFAEPARKRGQFPRGVQMRNVSVRGTAERGDPLFPLLRIYGRYR